MVAQKMAAVVEEVHLTFESRLKEDTKVAQGQNFVLFEFIKKICRKPPWSGTTSQTGCGSLWLISLQY